MSIGNMNDYEKQSTFFRGTFNKASRTVSNLRYETDALTVGAEDFCGTLFARGRTAWEWGRLLRCLLPALWAREICFL